MKKSVQLAQILQHGMAAHRAGRLTDAERSYQAVLNLKRDDFDSLHLLGVVRWQQRRHDEASKLIKQALRVRPDSAEACANLGIVLSSLAQPAEAIAAYDRALAINPRYGKALCHRGDALRALGRHAEALASYDKAVIAAPDYAEAHVNRGVVLRELDRHAEALASFDRALTLRPRSQEILYNRANSLQSLGRLEEALRDYDAVLAADSTYAEAHNNRGCVLEKIGRYAEALASLEAALTLRSDFTDAWYNRGNVLLKLTRFSDAVDSYDRVLVVEPERADAWNNRGNALLFLQHYDQAIEAFERTLRLDPDNWTAFALLASCQLNVCNWPETSRLGEQAKIASRAGDWSRLDPLGALHYLDDPADHLNYSRHWLGHFVPERPQPLPARTITRSDKIRVAYLSSDFRNHPVARAIVRLIELHDRSRFDCIGVSFGSVDTSDIRARIVAGFDQFHDVKSESDLAVAELVQRQGIDIVVSLNGHTMGTRPGILAYRPAPIQVTYLGYAGTVGADFIDYILADETVLPFDRQPFYCEKIVQLPGAYHLCDETREVSPRTPSRSELGLPERSFVFCCSNQPGKLSAPVFDVWMRLLTNVNGSVLWLSHMNDAARANLHRETAARGVSPDRVIFARREERVEDHLARHRQADLFLDTLPYNAHSTAIDALWAGLPVLTCAGRAFAGRVGASLLQAAGLPELIARNLEEYEGLARKLANDPPLLQSIRAKLAQNRSTCRLFDVERSCRDIEAAYATMRDIHLRGEPPRSFRVEPN
jgi:protein O-GlcNAc transferase